jgi:hypothetical protein
MADDPLDLLAKTPGILRLLASQTTAPATDEAALPPRIAALQALHDRATVIQAEGEALGEPLDWDEARAEAEGLDGQSMAAFTEGLDDLNLRGPDRRIPPPEDDETP